jgi:hypothetical protein
MRAFALAVVVAAARLAHAQAPSQEEQSRQHYRAGEQLYDRSRYAEALREFELGWALSPRPEFLINFAQSYRKLGDYDRALAECERYLATGPAPARVELTRQMMAAIREEKARSAVAPKQESRMEITPDEPVDRRSSLPAPPASAIAPAPAPKSDLSLIAVPPPATKKRSRAWIAGVVIGPIAIVATVGLAVGLTLGLSGETFPSSKLGTVSFR